ncbi:MAG: shikimate dehydrogenase [Burkholderiaceae bacterium]|nr:MAG: shikimate dehydrogenase [Burkholderiaceae bacterium]
MSDRYAVLGHPIGHSRSPQIHRWFAAATGQDLRYDALDAGSDVPSFLRTLVEFRAAGGLGVNVTLPYKLAALQAADGASEGARLAGAANTLKFEDGRIEARNTDGVGLVRDIETNCHVALNGRRVLLLGAGGAARGVLLPLAWAGARCIVVANRTAEKAQALASELVPHAEGTVLDGMGLDGLAGAGVFDVVINATSASLSGAALDISAGVFAADALAYDLVYGQGLTPFLRSARDAGVRHLADGTGMLVEQAADAFAWWRGVRPETATVRARLAVPLE